MKTTEKLNIEGKRSGDGFIAHKATLVNALSRTLADRITLMDLSIGRKGLLGYLKALGGGNIVKVAPSNGSASETQANGHKRLKVVCGSNTSFLDNESWIGDKTPMTFAEVRVSPKNSVKPNMGAIELAEAISRVLPFTVREDNRPILQWVKFEAKDGRLRLVSADGFRLAIMSLDFDGEGEALIHRDDLKGMANALKKARRIALSFEKDGEGLESKSLILDTELIRYKWTSLDGDFPDYEKLIPTDFNTIAHFDTVEAIRAVSSLKVLANTKVYLIDLTLGGGKLTMANPDDKGQAEINADTEGEGKTRVDGSYLFEVLKACGGMVDLKLANAYSPMLFNVDGYQVVLMPMFTEHAKAEQEKAQAEAKPAETVEAVAQAEDIARAVASEITEPVTEKPKRKHKAKEPVAVA